MDVILLCRNLRTRPQSFYFLIYFNWERPRVCVGRKRKEVVVKIIKWKADESKFRKMQSKILLNTEVGRNSEQLLSKMGDMAIAAESQTKCPNPEGICPRISRLKGENRPVD